MGLSCGYKCLQCMLVVMNAVVIVLGIALIVIGSIAEVNMKQMLSTDDAYLHGIVIFVIAFGCFLTLTGMFGFCGACKKNACCLIMYAILLSIFIVAGLAAGIAGFVLKDKLKDYTNNVVTEAYSKYTQGSDYANVIDHIQTWLSCCGPNGTWPASVGARPNSCNDHEGRPYTKKSPGLDTKA
ncbi:unnamed protein product [Dicrocoelium dendriticum]|nr:unnamed protein product [Dicrocoelium dendriticum]